MTDKLTASLDRLRQALAAMADKQRDLFCGWLVRWAGYLKGEATFDSSHMKTYRRGEIILVDFGYRLKSELGGYHYAVVLDKGNNPRNPLLMVLPLSSLKEGRDVHPNDVELGKALVSDIDPTTGENIAKSGTSVAVIQQLTCISKQRIIRPLTTDDVAIGRVSPEKMTEIDRKIANRFFSFTANFYSSLTFSETVLYLNYSIAKAILKLRLMRALPKGGALIFL